MKKFGFCIIGSLLLVSGCKKTPLPEVETEVPDFFLDCRIKDAPVLLEAGNDSYYMHASCYRDSGQVYVFKGDLRQSCNSSCGYGFMVLINDYKISAAGSPVDVNNALRKGSYSYNDNVDVPDHYQVQLDPVDPKPGNTYTWEVASTAAPDSAYQVSSLNKWFKTGHSYTVTLRMEEIAGCRTSHTRVYNIGSLHGDIKAESTSSSTLSFNFTTDLPDVAGNQYLWEFGDGASATAKDASHTFSPNGNWYQTTLRVITAAGDTILLSYQVPGTFDAICQANFISSMVPLPKTNTFSRVTVLVTDPNGNVFTTKGFQQPATSMFNIDEISDYDLNAENDPTKMLKVRLNCVLRNGNEEIRLTEGQASIAVAYK